MGRIATIFLPVAALMVVLSAGAAVAGSPIIGTSGDDQIKGTHKAEEIRGLGGEDEVVDGLGKDVVYGGDGADNLIGYGATLPWTASTVARATTPSSRATSPPQRIVSAVGPA